MVNKAKHYLTFIICRKDISLLLKDEICETMEEKSVNNLKMLFLPVVLVLLWSKQDNVFAIQGKAPLFCFFFFFFFLNNVEY